MDSSNKTQTQQIVCHILFKYICVHETQLVIELWFCFRLRVYCTAVSTHPVVDLGSMLI